MNRDSSAPAPERAARAASQFGLLRQRRFAPFFWTQFFGAANDNLFKFAFAVMATWQLSLAWLRPSTAGVVIGALFILPFLLFSATAGQLADKLDKSGLMRRVKELEIAIMLLAAQEPVGLMESKAKIRLREDRFSTIRRPIVVLSAKKRRKYGPRRRICSRFFISPTGC